MSKTDETAGNPNDAMPSGKPLEHDEVAATRDEGENGDDSFGGRDETDEDDDVSDANRENQASSAAANPDKFN